MKQVERKMLAAIKAKKNLTCGNTKVRFSARGNCIVYLFDNVIASNECDRWWFRDGDWRSATTKSRLNALLMDFSNNMVWIYQKDFQWYLRDAANNKTVRWNGYIYMHNDVLCHVTS
jgi:hypothetical protein